VNLLDLPAGWRDEAHRLRDRYARPDLAALCEAHAVELEAALQAEEEELLPPTESSAESGYSKRRLRDFVVDGKLENHGKKGAPLYKRGDLPRRRGKGKAGGFDAHEHVTDIMASS